jgi:hypothetical protein
MMSTVLKVVDRISDGSWKGKRDREFPYQTDAAFSKRHNEEGCYVQSIMRIAWEEGGIRDESLREGINRRVGIALEAGYISDKFFVRVPESLFLLCGVAAEFTNKWERPEREYREGERHILRMTYHNMYHFVVGKKGNKVGWDPWSPSGSLTGRHGVVLDKRVFVIRGLVGRVGGSYNG